MTVEPATFSMGATGSQGRNCWKWNPIMDSQIPQATVQKRHMLSRKMTIPKIMKFNSLSMEVLLNLVLPEFCINFVSLPANKTRP